jgi:hypothetical protein
VETDKQQTSEDLDATIVLLKKWLMDASAEKNKDKAISFKEKLQITDRLLKALALKYKNTDDGKGAKFGNLGAGK